jgi:hypothetical protein
MTVLLGEMLTAAKVDVQLSVIPVSECLPCALRGLRGSAFSLPRLACGIEDLTQTETQTTQMLPLAWIQPYLPLMRGFQIVMKCTGPSAACPRPTSAQRSLGTHVDTLADVSHRFGVAITHKQAWIDCLLPLGD